MLTTSRKCKKNSKLINSLGDKGFSYIVWKYPASPAQAAKQKTDCFIGILDHIWCHYMTMIYHFTAALAWQIAFWCLYLKSKMKKKTWGKKSKRSFSSLIYLLVEIQLIRFQNSFFRTLYSWLSMIIPLQYHLKYHHC